LQQDAAEVRDGGLLEQGDAAGPEQAGDQAIERPHQGEEADHGARARERLLGDRGDVAQQEHADHRAENVA